MAYTEDLKYSACNGLEGSNPSSGTRLRCKICQCGGTRYTQQFQTLPTVMVMRVRFPPLAPNVMPLQSNWIGNALLMRSYVGSNPTKGAKLQKITLSGLRAGLENQVSVIAFSSILMSSAKYASEAQLEEPSVSTRQDAGSNPVRGSKFILL